MARDTYCPHCKRNTLQKTAKTHTDTAKQKVTVWECSGAIEQEDGATVPCGYSEGRP